jgi:hypothetical protein
MVSPVSPISASPSGENERDAMDRCAWTLLSTGRQTELEMLGCVRRNVEAPGDSPIARDPRAETSEHIELARCEVDRHIAFVADHDHGRVPFELNDELGDTEVGVLEVVDKDEHVWTRTRSTIQ